MWAKVRFRHNSYLSVALGFEPYDSVGWTIRELLAEGKIVIDRWIPGHASSVDLHLDDVFGFLNHTQSVDVKQDQTSQKKSRLVPGIFFAPGEFVQVDA